MLWYSYYASFSDAFVRDALAYLSLDSGAHVLDPWNGSGTTTFVTAGTGVRASGFDLNPVMVIVARARNLHLPSVEHSIRPLACQILAAIETRNTDVDLNDPLCEWFSGDAASYIRSIERAINRILVNTDQYQSPTTSDGLRFFSELAAFFYTVLFMLVRELISPHRSSNPTWIKSASDEDKIEIDYSNVPNLFAEIIDGLKTAIASFRSPGQVVASPLVSLASSTCIPLGAIEVDAIITSPPYCTRIDYAIATKPELAVLNISRSEFRTLREKLIGAPVIPRIVPSQSSEWGKCCVELLKSIGEHSSKASKSYYLKTFLTYFDLMHQSFAEINRVLKPGGACCIVVQDSYYKDIHIDLASIFSEFADMLKWSTDTRIDYDVTSSMVHINSRSRKYRDAKTERSAETALFFRKAN